MPKPLTITLTGTFEMKDSVSLKELHDTVAEAEKILQRIGPGVVVIRIGRQELRV